MSAGPLVRIAENASAITPDGVPGSALFAGRGNGCASNARACGGYGGSGRDRGARRAMHTKVSAVLSSNPASAMQVSASSVSGGT